MEYTHSPIAAPDELRPYFIYALANPLSEELDLYYVGRTTAPARRWKEHSTPSVNELRTPVQVVNKWILNQEQEPIMLILERVSKDTAAAAEQKWIDVILAKGVELCNANSPVRGKGYSLTLEQKQAAMRRRWKGHTRLC